MTAKITDNGFVNFPNDRNLFNIKDGLTTINIVAFDTNDISTHLGCDSYILPQGVFVSDDIQSRNYQKMDKDSDLDKSIGNYLDNAKWNSIYFPETEQKSVPMYASICVGWINKIFENIDGNWSCTFENLTHNGKELYFLMKKLHFEKEVRILTFNKKY